MNKPVIAVVAIVAILLVAIGLGVTAGWFDDDDTAKEKEYVEYDSSKGWKSWNPKTYIIDSSLMSASPYNAITAKKLVEWYYDVEVEDKYTIKDVPADYYTYESVVSHNSNGNLVIKSYAKVDSANYDYKEIVVDKVPDYWMTSGSQIVTMYYILCQVHGTNYEDYDDAVLTELWNMVYATDKAGYESDRLTTNYGIPTDKFKGVKLISSTDTTGNKEQYTKILDDVKKEGKTIMYAMSGSMVSWTNGKATWITEQCEDFGSYATIYNISKIPNVLAMTEAFAYIMGYGDQAQSIIDNMRVSFYNAEMTAKAAAEKLDYPHKGVSTYVTSDWTFGDDSMAQEFFNIMHIENIYTGVSKTLEGLDELVVSKQPEFLLMLGKPPVDEKQLYRIKV